MNAPTSRSNGLDAPGDRVEVIFRAERSGPFKGDITAVFPYVPHDRAGLTMTCYAHIGQHGSCDLGWYWRTRPATPDEYAPLLAELKAIGYAPIVRRRIDHRRR